MLIHQKLAKKINFMQVNFKVIDTNEFVKKVQQDDNAVIIVTCSYFISIINFLDLQPQLNNMECFILPLIFIENPVNTSVISQDKATQKIPKIIHYCCFGDNKLPEKNKKCIVSWKEKCPDYKIQLWNESNIDFGISPWVKKYADLKKWAFVSDYIRAYVLYKYGGLYFDTDVEILRGFDDLLQFEAFGGYEKWPVLNTGGGCGSVSGFWLWKEIMKLKDETIFDNDYVVPQASGYYDTIPLVKKGLRVDGTLQNVDGFTIFPYDFFHPFDYISLNKSYTNNTHSIHYFNWSWADTMWNITGIGSKLWNIW